MYVPEALWYLAGKPYTEYLIKYHFEETLLMHSFIFPSNTQSIDIDFVDGNVVYTIEFTTQEHCDRALPFVANNRVYMYGIQFYIISNRKSDTILDITILRE